MLSKATLIAFNAHENQTDKAGKEYFSHPYRVAMRVFSETSSDELASAAMLHDVIEDTPITTDDLLKEGIHERIVEIVDTLTKRRGEEYICYLARIIVDEDAKRIKIADLLDNLREDRLCLLPEDVREKLEKKYQAALYFLKR